MTGGEVKGKDRIGGEGEGFLGRGKESPPETVKGQWEPLVKNTGLGIIYLHLILPLLDLEPQISKMEPIKLISQSYGVINTKEIAQPGAQPVVRVPPQKALAL